ncbi:MAG: peptidoglycan DD-metalloendopeptidase family protein [Candidatus Methylomirabilales bacterium]
MRHPCVTVVCLFGLLLTACGGREPRAIGVYHQVHPGQTLFRIAKTYGVDVGELSRVNRIADPADIEAGDRLFIPGARRVLEVPSYRSEETATLERKLPAREIGNSRVQFTWPVKGKIIARFGGKNELKNNGIAIAAPQGTPIRAAEQGKVIYSGAELRDYGNLIVIDHDGGLATVYAHNQVNLVKRGERVGRGQVIAKVGMTGIAETPYVHFEIRQNAKAKDPLAFLK